jgi:ribosomal protein L11 methyltransferase
LDIEAFDAAARDCDLVVANIVANTIVELAPSITHRLVEGGKFIASGIVEEHHDLVCSALEAVGLVPIETKREDIWVCLVCEKRCSAPPDNAALARAADMLRPIGSF